MGDEKNTEELKDVSGGPDTVAPSITDALEGVDGGVDSTGLVGSTEGLEVVGGDAAAPMLGVAVPLDEVDGGDNTNTISRDSDG